MCGESRSLEAESGVQPLQIEKGELKVGNCKITVAVHSRHWAMECTAVGNQKISPESAGGMQFFVVKSNSE